MNFIGIETNVWARSHLSDTSSLTVILQVGYEAGSEGTRLPPIYMNSLDNELIQVLHKAAQSSQDTNTVLELIFHVLDD